MGPRSAYAKLNWFVCMRACHTSRFRLFVNSMFAFAAAWRRWWRCTDASISTRNLLRYFPRRSQRPTNKQAFWISICVRRNDNCCWLPCIFALKAQTYADLWSCAWNKSTYHSHLMRENWRIQFFLSSFLCQECGAVYIFDDSSHKAYRLRIKYASHGKQAVSVNSNARTLNTK